MSQHEQKPERFNYGIALLRILACFMVIHIHFASAGTVNRAGDFLFSHSGVSVPVFVIMAILYTDFEKMATDQEFLKRRVFTLWFQMVFWGAAYWVMYRILNLVLHTDFRAGLSVLFFQLLFGSDINPVLWFNFDLIIATLIIYCAYRYTRKPLSVLSVIALAAIVFQWSGLNYRIFDPVRYEIAIPLKRMTEIMPFTVLALYLKKILYSKAIADTPKKSWILIICGIISLIFGLTPCALPEVIGYGYLTVNNLVTAPAMVLFSGFLPIGAGLSNPVKGLVKRISARTRGIYCIHIAAGNVLVIVLEKINLALDSIAVCLLVFVISLIIAELITRLPITAAKQIA